MDSKYHSSVTGKFVTKEFAEANPDTTVKLSHVNLKEEIEKFFVWFRDNGEQNIGISIEDLVDKYLEEKE